MVISPDHAHVGAITNRAFPVAKNSGLCDSVRFTDYCPDKPSSIASACRQSSYNPFQVREFLEKMPEKRVDARSGVFNNVAAAQRVLNDHLSQLRLKRSSQRDTILRVFLATRDHLTTEELHDLVKKQEPTIGYTTVYRALKLFIQCGLAAEVEFRDGVARFEHHMNRRNHHHMICTACGDSVEFFSPEIEEIERRIGKKFHYVTTQHSFQIYGTCEACRKKRSRLES
jgi:Fur family ferric uptake transcriptional regulator